MNLLYKLTATSILSTCLAYIFLDTLNWPPSELSAVSLLLVIFVAFSLLREKREKEDKRKHGPFYVSLTEEGYLFIKLLFFILYFLSIVILTQNVNSRPLEYFVLFSLMAMLLGFEILFVKSLRTRELLVQIFLLSINIMFSAYVVFPGLQGYDPWVHRTNVDQLLITGHTAAMGYNEWPVFHILIACFGIITQVDGVALDFLVPIGLAQALSIVLVYYIVKQFGNERVALLSSLFLSFSGLYISLGSHIIPQSLATVYIIYCIYFLIKTSGRRCRLLLAFFSLLVISTHAMSAFVYLIILMTFWSSKHIYRLISVENRMAITPVFVTLFAGGLIFHWIYVSGYLFREGILSLVYNVFAKAEVIHFITQQVQVNLVGNILNGIGWAMWIFFFVMSILLLAHRNFKSVSWFCFVCISMVLYFFIVGAQFFPFLADIQGVRYRGLQMFTLIPVASLGLASIRQLSRRTIALLLAGTILFSAGFFNVSSLSNNYDSPLFAEGALFVPAYTKNSEIIAANQMISYLSDNCTVYTTDHYHSYFFTKNNKENIYFFSFNQTDIRSNSHIFYSEKTEKTAFILTSKRKHGVIRDLYSSTFIDESLFNELNNKNNRISDNSHDFVLKTRP